MKTSGNTILITGGATGIGLAMAESFLKSGNEVIICGRRRGKLNAARKRLPGLHVRVCDVSAEKDRKSLFAWVSRNFREINIIINNAGIQRPIDLSRGVADLNKKSNKPEIDINLTAPIYLSALFIPHLAKRKEAAIINISSGLAFVPLAIVPVYCATKAGLHSYTVSLRHQLSKTGRRVFEIIPPMVDTELDGGSRDGRAERYRGIRPEEVASAAIDGIGRDVYEIAIGMAEGLRAGSRSDPDGAFARMNGGR